MKAISRFQLISIWNTVQSMRASLETITHLLAQYLPEGLDEENDDVLQIVDEDTCEHPEDHRQETTTFGQRRSYLCLMCGKQETEHAPLEA